MTDLFRAAVSWFWFLVGSSMSRLDFGFTYRIYQAAMRKSSDWQRPGKIGPWKEVETPNADTL